MIIHGAQWVKRWGRHYKVAQRLKFGVPQHPQHHLNQIPQHEQYSEYELGMTAYNNNKVVMTDYDYASE
ncbi:hypothetical protein A2U01_0099666 [Trifolium medium]|uniref:Uncharacterized protein n=1 Tax=Trifolium medium TaxID=97028 RepID=A0A392UQZ4_9FABA|nr:hypothetical protein [Trifolium medium]